MDREGRYISGLYQVSPKGVPLFSSPLKLTSVLLEMRMVDAWCCVEVRHTYQMGDVSGDVCAAFPLLAMGGSQFSVLFSVNNVPVKPHDNPNGIPYLFTRSDTSTEQVHPKLYHSVVQNVPAGKSVVVHITFVRQFSFRGNSLRLYFPSALVNVNDSMDSKIQKKLAKSWSAIVSCVFHVHMMSKIVSLSSTTDKIDVSLSTARPRETLIQFQRSNPVSPIELVVNVADAQASSVYFVPLELGSHEQVNLHNVSTVSLNVSVPKLNFSHRPLPEVVFLLDCSDSTRDGAFKFLSACLLSLIKRLPDDAPFNVISFGKEADIMWPKSQLKSKKTAAAAGKFVGGLKPTSPGSDFVGALAAAANGLARFDGFERNVVVLTDGLGTLTLPELEVYLNMTKDKVMRIFCLGYGPSSLRLCLRLSSVGRGAYVVADAVQDSEKLFKPALDELMKCVTQPPTVMTNLELKFCSFNDVYLDRNALDACFEGQRVNFMCTLPPEVGKISGKIGLFLGEGAVQIDLDQSVVVFDRQHPLSEVLRKVCAHGFMEEMMQARTVRNDRVARRKAMADHYLIESRWTGNIVTTPSSGTSSSQAVPEPFYDTKQPGQIKHRGMPKKDAGRPMMVRQDGITAVSSAPVSPVTETHAVASEAQQQQQLKLVHMGPQAGVVTWPRPQPTTDDNVEQRKRVMRNWRGAAALNSGGILLDRDQLYRIEAEGMALDMALSHVSSKMKVAPENFSRSTVKLVQRAVAQTVTKFDELFATRELAPIAELRQLILKTVDELGFSQDKLVSSLSSIDDIKSVAGLTSACGKGGQRPAMEDRHVCLPHFFTLTHVSTIAQDAFFCAVYDGHAGPLAAEFCRLQLHLNMVREHHSKDWPGAIRAAFHVTDQQFREIANVRDLKDGTTATVILIEDGTLYHANVGDGEGFLHWKDGRITPVTKAHKVSDRDEVARIEELEKRKKTRVLLNLGPGGMAVSDPDGNYMRVSRSIGDRMYDSEIVTCDPYLGQIALSADADFVVIASDGIWDFLSFKEVAEIVGALTGSSQVKAAELLVDEALKRGSMDNCTAVVVFLSSGRPTSTSLSRTSERDK